MAWNRKSKVELEDGTTLWGKRFGSDEPVAGEVVFYTAMVGYPESLTDPSYQGQILVSTFPMVGNYGVPASAPQEPIEPFYESHRIHASGLIITDYACHPSHWNASKSLDYWLKEWNIPALYGIDTRHLTKLLREKGSMMGRIVGEGQSVDFYNPNRENLVAQVSSPKVQTYGTGKYRVVLVDCGVKNNIIRSLLQRECMVIRVPWDYDFSQESYDGLFLSNGPGDPARAEKTITHIRQAMNEKKPIMGICLGNQLLGRAAGAKTYKLKYGHRSHNQPVILQGTNSCFITSQNHGYAIDNESLPSDWEVLFYNANDGSNEGIKHKTKPFFSVQFHPEAASGPTDTAFLFDDFVKAMS